LIYQLTAIFILQNPYRPTAARQGGISTGQAEQWQQMLATIKPSIK
jgi:hypothetical protein